MTAQALQFENIAPHPACFICRTPHWPLPDPEYFKIWLPSLPPKVTGLQRYFGDPDFWPGLFLEQPQGQATCFRFPERHWIQWAGNQARSRIPILHFSLRLDSTKHCLKRSGRSRAEH